MSTRRYCVGVVVFLSLSLVGGVASGEPSTESGDSELPMPAVEGETATSETDRSAPSTSSEGAAGAEEKKEASASLRPGQVDLNVSAGLGGLVYGTLEPGVEVGVVPLGDDISMSLGATVGLGYCILCGLVSPFIDGFSIGVWNVTPQGRLSFHFDVLDLSDNTNFDIVGGLGLGPSFYRYSARFRDVRATGGQTTFLTTLFAGLRVFPSGTSGFFIFGEARYGIEAGFNEVTIESDEWSRDFRFARAYSRAAIDAVLGLGIRL